MTPHVLLAEDDTELCSLMADYFEPCGFIVEAVHDGRRALRRALEGGFDMVILDVMMPVLDGFEVLRQILKHSAVPVIMLTARTAQADRIGGLNAGADDYLPKPSRPKNCWPASARYCASRPGGPDHRFAPGMRQFEGELVTRKVWLRGEPVTLTSIEFDILECLVRSVGLVVSVMRLRLVYQREISPFERSLDVQSATFGKT